MLENAILALGALVGLSLVALLYRAVRQSMVARRFALHGPNAIAEAGFKPIAGIEQWVQIRGEDCANPVLLFVHGGPGVSSIATAADPLRSWERDFIVAQWDQRGAGRTFIGAGRSRAPAPTMDEIVNDGLEIADLIRLRLDKAKLILVGASWGSAVGIEMIRRRPDLFAAYVGTGQVVNTADNETLGYRLLMERLVAGNDRRAIKRLEKIGPPPYADVDTLGRERQILLSHPPESEKHLISAMLKELAFAPGYSLRDAFDVLTAMMAENLRPLFDEFTNYDLARRGYDFAVPLFFFQGAEDIQTPTRLVEEVFAKLTAPQKELVLIEGGGHAAFAVFAERFREELVKRVRPLAI